MGDRTSDGILYLFDRPIEPSFLPKGDDNVSFDVPENYLVDRYRPLADNLGNRFGGGDKIQIQDVTLPDISFPLSLGRRAPFSLFIPLHRKMGARLIECFMGMKTKKDFLSAAVFCRDRMNPYLFIYALSVAILHRPDTKNIPIPPLSEVFPDKYMDSEIFARAREESNIVEAGSRIPLEIPRDYTASDLEEEHRIAYFREDIGINLHHWHWHLVYPFDAPREIVDKDRRGELFYYMHQQIIGRYNFERFSNNLARVKRFINWREAIPEGYFPKLDSLVSSRVWPSRTANSTIRDVYREVDQIKFDIQDLERWRDRFFEAIHTGRVITSDGQTLQLTESQGIDILGNMMEASILSVNPNLYGDLHNLGHVAISLCHDPDHRNLETFGVMGDSSTAMRDPVFYRWHAMINDMFEEHKNTLPRYATQQLDFSGVSVTSVEINVGQQKNLLATFWQQSDVDLSRGLDFSPRGSVFARFTHLQHAPFSYNIQVENAGAARQGTVRIFLAPKFDERGLPFLFRDQKNLFIELDRFVVNLKPNSNTIQRQSKDSSVTIPFERTFRNLEAGRPTGGTALEQFNYCGCGWPQHMLIPKGTAAGLQSQLFVMVSDYEADKVQQTGKDVSCDDASSYCGVRDGVYPDRRSMGFPFDRQPRDGVNTLQDFLTPNMAVQDVIIKFTERTISPQVVGQNLVPRS